MTGLMAFPKRLELSAEARFFIQALVCQQRELLDSPFRVKPVARLMRLTERLVREATYELAGAGLLVAKRQEGRVGRPRQEYEASKYLHDLLKGIDESSGFHQDLVLRLFSEPDIYVDEGESTDKGLKRKERTLVRKGGGPAAPGARGLLRAPTRMLMAALLTSADQCGVVANLGEANLRAMTGLSSAALKHQVKRLIRLGFIRLYVPGLSSRIFVGARATSTFYLKLEPSQLGESFEFALVNPPYEMWSQKLVEGLPQEIAEALLALEPAVLDVLHHKLIGYVSCLLTMKKGEEKRKVEDASEVEGAREADADRRLSNIISDELGVLELAPRGVWAGLSAHFEGLALEWFRSLQHALGRSQWQLVRLIPFQGKGSVKMSFVLFMAQA